MYSGTTLGSIYLGRWSGLPIRLHISCLLVAVFTFFFRDLVDSQHLLREGCLILFVWFSCVLLHELGHCISVKRVGGTNDMLVLTPFGGLSFHTYPQQAGRDLWVALSGPLMNLAGMALAAVLLLSLQENPWQTPFATDGTLVEAPPLVTGMRLALWINLGLFVLNMVPSVPLDGSWILQSLISPAVGDRRGWHISRRASVVSVFLLIALAIATRGLSYGGVPLWLPLTVIAVYCLCFSSAPLSLAIHIEEETELTTPLENTSEDLSESEFHPLGSWQPQQNENGDIGSEEEDEEYMVDAILQCVHDRGIDSLTRAQRKILQRAAQRYRSRPPE